MMEMIIGIMGFIFLVMIILIIVLPILKEQSLRKQGKIVRILLYESIGQQKVFRGVIKGYEKNDEALGVYFELGKSKKVISTVDPENYFGDIKYSRSLMVCKYADDDFRVISRLQAEGWLKKVKLPLDKYLKTEIIEDSDTGEKRVEVVKDKKGNPIPLLDDDGQPLPDYEFIEHEEPLGVDQTHREVMRFNRVFAKRMQEKRKQNPGWLEKYLPYITTIAVVFIMFIAFAYMTNKNNEFMEKMIDQFGENADQYIKATNEPTFAENIMNSIEKRNKEEEAPPK